MNGPTIRRHRAGDIGWVIHRQAILYVEEFGLDATFEALLAEIGAAFIRTHDPAREACWIAERDGVRLGSVTLVRQDDAVAKLRILHVERDARGTGVGRLLVETCLAFAAASGYARVTLWTNDVNEAARRLYAACGFRMVATNEPAVMFGRRMTGETWEIAVEPGTPDAGAR